MQLRKESLKKSGLPGFEPWPLRYRCSALITARIFFTFISSFRSSNTWISYIHNFIFIFPGYITNQFNDQLPVGLLAQLVRALHRYRRGQGSNPGKPDFFRLSFRNCVSCVNNCEDLLYIYLIVTVSNFIETGGQWILFICTNINIYKRQTLKN